MAEPFNVEQFRQQMSGQAPHGAQPQPQPQMMPNPATPQPYQPPQMPQTQAQPHPYQPQPMPQAAPQQFTPPPMAQPHAAPQHQVQAQAIPQQQMLAHHMAAPAFAPPPTMAAEVVPEVSKKSRFSLKRAPKIKIPKIKKNKTVQIHEPEVVHKVKTSPAMIFMFGMATGIVCFLVGNMLMSTLLGDNSAKDFAEVQRLNTQSQQPVLPEPAQNTDSAAETATP